MLHLLYLGRASVWAGRPEEIPGLGSVHRLDLRTLESGVGANRVLVIGQLWMIGDTLICVDCVLRLISGAELTM